jgi:hypothetical protein
VLQHQELYSKVAPSFAELNDQERKGVEAMFSTFFQMAQLDQGECSPDSIMPLSKKSIMQYATEDNTILQQVCSMGRCVEIYVLNAT